MRVFLLVVPFVLLACNSDANNVTIRASDYDQSCTQASDCMIINEGACCPQCAFAAISKSAQTKFQADDDRRTKACAGSKCALPPCAAPQIACVANKCKACIGAGCEMDAGTKDASSTDASKDVNDATPD